MTRRLGCPTCSVRGLDGPLLRDGEGTAYRIAGGSAPEAAGDGGNVPPNDDLLIATGTREAWLAVGETRPTPRDRKHPPATGTVGADGWGWAG